MGLSFIEMMFSIFRGHIPDNAVRSIAPVAIPPGAIMGVLAAAAAAVGLTATALWAIIWIAIRLI